jgi:hypothetical protein
LWSFFCALLLASLLQGLCRVISSWTCKRGPVIILCRFERRAPKGYFAVISAESLQACTTIADSFNSLAKVLDTVLEQCVSLAAWLPGGRRRHSRLLGGRSLIAARRAHAEQSRLRPMCRPFSDSSFCAARCQTRSCCACHAGARWPLLFLGPATAAAIAAAA